MLHPLCWVGRVLSAPEQDCNSGWQEKGAALEKLQVLGACKDSPCQILGAQLQPQLGILSTQIQDSC